MNILSAEQALLQKSGSLNDEKEARESKEPNATNNTTVCALANNAFSIISDLDKVGPPSVFNFQQQEKFEAYRMMMKERSSRSNPIEFSGQPTARKYTSVQRSIPLGAPMDNQQEQKDEIIDLMTAAQTIIRKPLFEAKEHPNQSLVGKQHPETFTPIKKNQGEIFNAFSSLEPPTNLNTIDPTIPYLGTPESYTNLLDRNMKKLEDLHVEIFKSTTEQRNPIPPKIGFCLNLLENLKNNKPLKAISDTVSVVNITNTVVSAIPLATQSAAMTLTALLATGKGAKEFKIRISEIFKDDMYRDFGDFTPEDAYNLCCLFELPLIVFENSCELLSSAIQRMLEEHGITNEEFENLWHKSKRLFQELANKS